MSTACELLRSKLQPSRTPATPVPRKTRRQGAAAAAAAAGSGFAARCAALCQPRDSEPRENFPGGRVPAIGQVQHPERRFDTEKECDVQKSLDQAAVAEVDALTELEPMAAAVEDAPAAPAPTEPQDA